VHKFGNKIEGNNMHGERIKIAWLVFKTKVFFLSRRTEHFGWEVWIIGSYTKHTRAIGGLKME